MFAPHQVSELMRCTADQNNSEAEAQQQRELCERLGAQLAGMCSMIGIPTAQSPEETAAAVSAWVEQVRTLRVGKGHCLHQPYVLHTWHFVQHTQRHLSSLTPHTVYGCDHCMTAPVASCANDSSAACSNVMRFPGAASAGGPGA